MSDDLNDRSKIWILAVASSLRLLLFFSLVLGGERALLPERAQIRSPLLSISWIQITLFITPIYSGVRYVSGRSLDLKSSS